MDPDTTAELVAELVPQLPPDAVVVLDALALTCGAVTADLLRPREGRVVLTPNDDEMERLIGRRPGDDLPYGDLARLAAQELGAVVALRGAVASPDGRAWYGQAGHAGLGTSGSGDVLAGLVTGLAARGAPVEQAAVWGVHLHGEAGERLAARVGRLGFLARELLDEIPGVLTQLEA
jgi:NAD(P)H-hydrate repair Nnr-like enzyme with NAD(P)H-hydrate dehydratase domain